MVSFPSRPSMSQKWAYDMFEAWAQAVEDGIRTGAFPERDWVHWGDSLTTAGSGGDWVGKLAAVTGLSHANQGIGGQGVHEIAARQGGSPFLVTTFNNVIPGSGDVAVVGGRNFPLIAAGSVPGTLGGVPGMMNYSGTAWRFARSEPGDTVHISEGTPFYTDASIAYRARRSTISMGRNSFKLQDASTIVDKIEMARQFSQNASSAVVFDVAPWASDTSSDLSTISSLNAAIKAKFPLVFDGFARLRSGEALTAVGHQWTNGDQADVAAGITPRSFRSDGGHLNDFGGEAFAQILSDWLYYRGLIHVRAKQWGPNLYSNGDFESDTSGWGAASVPPAAWGRVTSDAVRGSACLSVSFAEGANSGVQQSARSVVSGSKTARARAYFKAPVGFYFRLVLHMYYNDGSSDVYISNAQSEVQSVDTDWQVAQVQTVLPANVNRVTLQVLKGTQSSSSTATVFVDNISLHVKG